MKINLREENDNYRPKHDSINKLSRNMQIRIFILITGHCVFKAHLHRMGLTDSVTCRCGAPKKEEEEEE